MMSVHDVHDVHRYEVTLHRRLFLITCLRLAEGVPGGSSSPRRGGGASREEALGGEEELRGRAHLGGEGGARGATSALAAQTPLTAPGGSACSDRPRLRPGLLFYFPL